MPIAPADQLEARVASIFEAVGAAPADAGLVARSLVEAEMSGHESHGLTRVSEYVRHIRSGSIVPEARPEIVAEHGSLLLVDGHWGFGQVVATRATEWLIDRTREHGTAGVAIRNCGHVGRAGAYPEQAADAGLVAFAFVNGGGKEARLAPHGGSRPVFGTNPLAAAVPLADGPPIVIDFSTASVASGKIRVLRDRGEPLPKGWIVDRDGNPSSEPRDYYDGGMLLPAAAHKGYGLALLVEVLAGCLTGAGSVAVPGSGYRLGNGVFLQALDPRGIDPSGGFATAVGELAEVLRSTPPAPGTEAVLLPGDPERRSRERRATEGIPVADSVWETISGLAAEVGASPE